MNLLQTVLHTRHMVQACLLSFLIVPGLSSIIIPTIITIIRAIGIRASISAAATATAAATAATTAATTATATATGAAATTSPTLHQCGRRSRDIFTHQWG
jgi:type IV secretory pathway TrbL component